MRSLPAASIAHLRNALHSGSKTPEEILSVHQTAWEKSAALNAFVTSLFQHGSASASQSQQQQPLQGIPFAVKDNFCIKGIPTTCASKMLQPFVPAYDATVVKRLRDAGAVLVGKTNMDEFAMGSGSVDSVVGPVKNPWNPLHIAGGSSGGSAVAVASGAAHFALGSDTGGSVRNPAGHCGIVGFKPSYGSVSRHGLIPLLNSTDVPSIFARLVEDVRTVFRVIAGCDIKDSTTFRKTLPEEKADVKRLRIGVAKEYNVPELSDDMRECWMRVADALEEQGADVRSVSLPHSEYANACYTVLNTCDVASNMARYDGIEFGYRSNTDRSSTNALYAATRHEAFNEVVRGRILAGNFFLLKRNFQNYFVRAAQVRRLIAEDFQKAFDSVDVILTPVTLTDAPSFPDFTAIDNRTQQEVQDLFTVGASLAGLPAVSVPVSWSARGLPMGMQLIAPFWRDYFLLDVAEILQHLVNFYHVEK
ncbi:glutamyl-tRNA(Gln) amidotransferase subunit A, mitochondrial-like [Paramacrobiotus metropolitanus]|uniref:glutamyl-tRNA(Gln) amidotransferase subunit A, mitochondrial-like n=1 Tax=Paramacrobiotus metropolitanus TaxID=2943436 RepID=UPI002445C554|nr:glutamyl-tRNA(Gln) amidotransferase subunit A, mitochondrial-like [Paramacrobiotus metropolitanus]